MSFQWIPYQGMNPAAIERMKQHFKKPDYDPPEAWFMSMEQGYHRGLSEAVMNLNDKGWLDVLGRFLFDTGGGIKNFGRFKEWVDWYQFLLPYILENILDNGKGMDGGLPELTINYFINLYPTEIIEEYPGFR
jgi:hypothetical protein